MKSTKYELLKADYNHACEQLKIRKKLIEELREENKRLKPEWVRNNNLALKQLSQTKKALKRIVAEEKNYFGSNKLVEIAKDTLESL